MPQYLYECSICGEFEATHSIKEELTECPQCKERKQTSTIKRLITMSSFVLGTGGVGWAKDSYSK